MAIKPSLATRTQAKTPPLKAVRTSNTRAKTQKSTTSKPSRPATSKLDQMIAAMRAAKGASITDLMTIARW